MSSAEKSSDPTDGEGEGEGGSSDSTPAETEAALRTQKEKGDNSNQENNGEDVSIIDFNNDDAQDSEEIRVSDHFSHDQEEVMEVSADGEGESQGGDNDPLNNQSKETRSGAEKNAPTLPNALQEEGETSMGGSSEKSAGKNPLSDNENSNPPQQVGGGDEDSQPKNDDGQKKNVETENGSGDTKRKAPQSDDSVLIIQDDETSKEQEESVVRIRQDGIFEEENESDDDVVEVPNDEYEATPEEPPDITSMMQMSFREEDDESVDQGEKEFDEAGSPEEDIPHRRPTRRAAAAAAETIKEISNLERASDSHREMEYTTSSPSSRNGGADAHSCHGCKKWTHCSVKVSQYGMDLFFCGNTCFNKHRNSNNAAGRLSCAKCGRANLDLPDDTIFYWETMNFCTDKCVANYQVEVGSSCASCNKSVPWLSLGKYCVRFGNDIRQFCTAPCLESYKKNARVCFNCQLDIKRLGNVILASLPGKTSPKEFCSQDCVEMYMEQNYTQIPKPSKPSQLVSCVLCGCNTKPCYKELVKFSPRLTNSKTCSDECWKQLLQSHRIYNPKKCDSTCSKYINLDFSNPPPHFVSTSERVFGFCSPTCKNVFVLKNRQILACHTCKVKKYNYDLIQFFNGRVFGYATCSLNCLPFTPQYIRSLRNELSNLVDGGHQGVRSTPVTNSMSSLVRSRKTYRSAINNDNDVPVFMDTSGNVVHVHGTCPGVQIQQIFEVDSAAGGRFRNVGCGNEQLGDGEEKKWDGILRAKDVDEMLKYLEPPETKNKCTMARPKRCTVSTQTEESAIADMERIPLKTVETIKYVPLPLPFPVYIPVPMYFMETPVPYPFAVPFPVPLPFPISSKSAPEEDEAEHEICTPELQDATMEDVQSESNSEIASSAGQTKRRRLEEPDPTPMPAKLLSPEKSVSSQLTATPGSSPVSVVLPRKKLTRVEYGLRAWKMTFDASSDPVSYNASELASKLVEWVNNARKPNGEKYRADILLYLCVGVQEHLQEQGRPDNIFYDSAYSLFVQAITEYADNDCAQGVNTRIEDRHLWESQQLGDSTPGVLLFTLIYLFYKNFHLKTWENHSALTFETHIKLERKLDPATGNEAQFIRIDNMPDCEGIEVMESPEVPERCLIRLYSLYLSKCDNLEGPLYKSIKPDYQLSDTVWYGDDPLGQMHIYQMLVRAMMIKADSDI